VFIATRRADALLDLGDPDDCRAWMRIAKSTAALEKQRPGKRIRCTNALRTEAMPVAVGQNPAVCVLRAIRFFRGSRMRCAKCTVLPASYCTGCTPLARSVGHYLQQRRRLPCAGAPTVCQRHSATLAMRTPKKWQRQRGCFSGRCPVSSVKLTLGNRFGFRFRSEGVPIELLAGDEYRLRLCPNIITKVAAVRRVYVCALVCTWCSDLQRFQHQRPYPLSQHTGSFVTG
jgi:hypothetical protein